MTANLLSLLADHLVLVCVGLLAAAALAWPARALLKRDPQSCYQLLLALLVGAVAVLPLQFLVQGSAAQIATPARDWIRSLVEPLRERDVPGERGAPDRKELPFKTFLVDGEPAASAAGEVAAATTPSGAAPEAKGAVPAASDLDAASAATPALVDRLLAAASGAGRSLAAFVRGVGWERGATGAWLLGVALIVARRLLRVLRTLRLVARAQPVRDPEILSLWRRVGDGSRIAARVRLVSATSVVSPACTGLFRRVLILPARPKRPLAPGILEWALRHELVHLERGDQWAALFQSAVTALLWFHPAAWWLSGEIGRLRELSCDQRVVESSGRRKSYALALLECAASLSNSITADPITASDAEPHSAGVRCALLHWSRSPTQIRRRIEMLTLESKSLPRARKVLGIVVAGCALAIPALAQVAGAAALLPARQQAPAPSPTAAPALPPAPALAPADDQDAVPPSPAAPKKKRRHVTAPDSSAPWPAPVAPTADPAVLPPAPPQPPPASAAAGGIAVGVPTLPFDPNLELPAVAVDPGPRAGPALAAACDDGVEQYSAAVRADMRNVLRQVEQALKQQQRAQASQQNGMKRQVEQLRRQEERARDQQERMRATIADRLAKTDDDAQRADLEKQLAKLEADAERASAECELRSADLKAAIEKLGEADLADCFESLGDFRESMDGEIAQLTESIQAMAMQAAQQDVQQAKKLRKLGYTNDDDDDDARAAAAKQRKVDVEKAVKKAQAASERARVKLKKSLVKESETGALSADTRRAIEEALARVEQIDAEKLQVAIDRAMAAAKKAAAAANRAGEEADEAVAPRAPRAAAKARSAEPPAKGSAAPGSPALPRRPGNGAPQHGPGSGGSADEAKLLEKISALEDEIATLRAELEQMRAAPADPEKKPAPTKRVRAMR